MKLHKFLLTILLILAALSFTACSPDYPKCDNDSDCASNEKGKAEGRLFCVNGLCQQCRSSNDCAGAGMTCNAGLCERMIGYCTGDSNCLDGQKCRNNQCGPECLDKSECGDGKDCRAGRCVAAVECTMKSDCKGGYDCVGGKCTSADSGPACQLDTIYFNFNSSVLEPDFLADLQRAGSCIKQKNLRVRIEGNTDERGTVEYNLALGERRARSVYDYFVKMGVDGSRLSTISYGKENPAVDCGPNASDSCYRKNRRVNFQIR